MRKVLFGLLAVLILLPLLAIGVLRLVGLERLRPWIEQAAASALDRPVTIRGGIGLALSLRPTLVVEDVTIGSRSDEPPGELARIGRLEVGLGLLPLMRGAVELDRLLVADATIAPLGKGLRRDREADPAPDPTGSAAPAPLPVAREVRLERVRLRIPAGEARPALELTIAELDGRLPDPAGALEIETTGALDGRPVSLRLGLTSPAALLERRPVRLEPIAIRLGDSDLEGALSLDPGGPRARLEGTLTGRRLELPLLAAVLDGSAVSAEAGAGDRRRGGGGVAGRAGRVIPDLPVELSGLRAVEAELRLRVGELVTGGPILRDLDLPLRLGAGRLEIGPIALGLAGGRITGRIEADGVQSRPSVRVELAGRGIATAPLQRELAVEPNLESTLDLDLELTGRGGTLAELLASADGELTAALRGGRLRALALDRIAGGVREAVRALSGQGGNGWVELRCAAVDLPIRAGIAELRVAVAETARARLTGEGRVDLGSERLDLTLLPRSRGATLSIAVPVRVRGTFAAPEISLDQRDAARRAALGLLGAFVFPPAALAAFADLGVAGNPCLAPEPAPAEAAPATSGAGVPGTDALRRGLEGLFGGGRR